MLSDPYITSSNFRPQKKASECKIKDFYEKFEKYYIDVRAGKNPDLPHVICDPYGFALLCKDYEESPSSEKIENDIFCKESFLNTQPTIYDSIFKHKFPFKVLLDLLYSSYLFDYDLAMKVYNVQKSAFDIFNQIMNGQGYVINRLAPHKKKVRKLINNAYKSRISLNEDKYIPLPYRNRVCDGKVWPCIVTNNPPSYLIKKIEVNGYGEGLFLVGVDDLIYDVLKINDLWLVDTPLDNRLKFGSKAKGYNVAEYSVVYSWRTALDFGRLMDCNKTDGLLIRPCHEDFFDTSWFEWSRTSLIYCCSIKGKLQIANRKSSEPDYYTLEGDLGEVNPYEQRVFERIWLDDFDIKEFQQILKLRDI